MCRHAQAHRAGAVRDEPGRRGAAGARAAAQRSDRTMEEPMRRRRRLGRARASVSARRAILATRLVLAIGLLALTGVSLYVLSDRAQRRSGTDLTTNAGYAIELGAEQ